MSSLAWAMVRRAHDMIALSGKDQLDKRDQIFLVLDIENANFWGGRLGSNLACLTVGPKHRLDVIGRLTTGVKVNH